MSEELRVLKNIELKLDNILKWTRFAGILQLRDILLQTLTDDKSLLIYEYSDGKRTTREVARLVNIGHVTVSRYWRHWNKIGIIEPSPKYKGRFQRICSLEEFGITIPPIQVEEKK